ncbi:MAG: Type 1 glutamine amidotransferase-like domain-containing protein [Clostridia bacterium]|nr:Type 1 glutamine amidotransferase-like domain-containing protein [Clostridia bacterium]
MTNILLEGYDLNAPWLFGTLKRYLRPCHRVAVIALAFRDALVKNADDWNALYSKENGCWYEGIVGAFADYGIAEEQIAFVDYFTDTPASAAEKIENADVLYFPGGLPDRMMDRIREMGLVGPIARHGGLVMGYSAGAVIQLREYHLSPDDDYPGFGYYEGLGLTDGFYLEVHYEGVPAQDEAIRRVLRERGATVYATKALRGALVVDGGRIEPVGEVLRFDP